MQREECAALNEIIYAEDTQAARKNLEAMMHYSSFDYILCSAGEDVKSRFAVDVQPIVFLAT